MQCGGEGWPPLGAAVCAAAGLPMGFAHVQCCGGGRQARGAAVGAAAGLPLGRRHVLRGGGSRQARGSPVGEAARGPLERARVHDGRGRRPPLGVALGARQRMPLDRADVHRGRSRRAPAGAQVAAREWLPVGQARAISRRAGVYDPVLPYTAALAGWLNECVPAVRQRLSLSECCMRLRTARGKGAAGAEGGEGEEAAGEEEGSPLARTTRRRPPERHVVRAVAPAPTRRFVFPTATIAQTRQSTADDEVDEGGGLHHAPHAHVHVSSSRSPPESRKCHSDAALVSLLPLYTYSLSLTSLLYIYRGPVVRSKMRRARTSLLSCRAGTHVPKSHLVSAETEFDRFIIYLFLFRSREESRTAYGFIDMRYRVVCALGEICVGRARLITSLRHLT